MADWGSFFSWKRATGRPVTPAAREREMHAGIRKALFALLAHDHAAVEAGLSEAVRADSASIDCYVALAGFYRDRGEVGRAIRVHQNLLLRRDLAPPERIAVLIELARDFAVGGFLRRAVASFEEVLAHDTRHVAALSELIPLYASLREYPEALAIHKRLTKAERHKDPIREARLRLGMAELAHEEGRAGDARKAARLAVKRDPTCARAQILLGQLEVERGRDKAALATWQKVPEMDPRAAAEIYPRLEAAFSSVGKGDAYVVLMRDLLAKHGSDIDTALALADGLSARGETDASLQVLRDAVDASPDDLRARVRLGRRLIEAEGEGEVAKEYARLLELLDGPVTPVGRNPVAQKPSEDDKGLT